MNLEHFEAALAELVKGQAHNDAAEMAAMFRKVADNLDAGAPKTVSAPATPDPHPKPEAKPEAKPAHVEVLPAPKPAHADAGRAGPPTKK